jgi:hypothetical protein
MFVKRFHHRQHYLYQVENVRSVYSIIFHFILKNRIREISLAILRTLASSPLIHSLTHSLSKRTD